MWSRIFRFTVLLCTVVIVLRLTCATVWMETNKASHRGSNLSVTATPCSPVISLPKIPVNEHSPIPSLPLVRESVSSFTDWLHACVRARQQQNDIPVTGDMWGFDGHRFAGRIIYCLALRDDVVNALDLNMFTGSATVTLSTALQRSSNRKKVSGQGLVFGLEGRAEQLPDTLTKLQTFAGENHNIVVIADVSSPILPLLLEAVEISLIVWDPAPAGQYNGKFAWTRETDFQTIQKSKRGPLYWAINNCNYMDMNVEFARRLEEPASTYELVAAFPDTDAVYQQQPQLMKVYRRKAGTS